MNPSRQAFLNHAQLRSMTEFTGGGACHVVDRFAADLPARIQRIHALLEPSGTELADAELHRLKGAAATCGFRSLAAMLDALRPGETCDCQRLRDCATKSLDEWREFRKSLLP